MSRPYCSRNLRSSLHITMAHPPWHHYHAFSHYCPAIAWPSCLLSLPQTWLIAILPLYQTSIDLTSFSLETWISCFCHSSYSLQITQNRPNSEVISGALGATVAAYKLLLWTSSNSDQILIRTLPSHSAWFWVASKVLSILSSLGFLSSCLSLYQGFWIQINLDCCLDQEWRFTSHRDSAPRSHLPGKVLFPC